MFKILFALFKKVHIFESLGNFERNLVFWNFFRIFWNANIYILLNKIQKEFFLIFNKFLLMAPSIWWAPSQGFKRRIGSWRSHACQLAWPNIATARSPARHICTHARFQNTLQLWKTVQEFEIVQELNYKMFMNWKKFMSLNIVMSQNFKKIEKCSSLKRVTNLKKNHDLKF